MCVTRLLRTSKCPAVFVLATAVGAAADQPLFPTERFEAGSDVTDLASADFNADGSEDLAALNVFRDRVSILLGEGDGSFRAPAHFETSFI